MLGIPHLEATGGQDRFAFHRSPTLLTLRPANAREQ